MFKYLREKTYYNDLYDLWTIEECLRFRDSWDKAVQKSGLEEKMPKLSVGKRKLSVQFIPGFLYFIKGERYRKKQSTIQEWMERDRTHDEFIENAKEPRNIRCSNCAESMHLMLKEPYDFTGKPLRVLFFFECPACKERRGIFDNGEEFKPKPDLCPKCNQVIKVAVEEQGGNLVWSKNCTSCGFAETKIDDCEKKDAERLAEEKRKKELLEKYRDEFCFSEKEWHEYLYSIDRREQLKKLIEESELKRKDPDYKKVENLNKWTIAQLEKTLLDVLEKERYQKLILEKPEIGKHVIVPFSVQDFDSSRNEWDSKHRLAKIIKKSLLNSNWRLMSEGTSYRLGYLSGRLKGYEEEEDLVQMIKQEKSVNI